MGSYLFGIQNRKHAVKFRTADGRDVEAVALKFIGLARDAYPAVFADRTNPLDRYALALNRAAESWGQELPEFAVVTSKDRGACEGCTVLRWNPEKQVVVDDPDWEGRSVGSLRVYGNHLRLQETR